MFVFVAGWGLMTNPVTASAWGGDFGVVRFGSEPESYWRDPSGPVLLAQAGPGDSSEQVIPNPPAPSDSGSGAQVLPVTPAPSTHPDTLRTAPATTAPHDSLGTGAARADSLHPGTGMPDSLHARSAPPETLRATSARPETLFAPPPRGVSAKPAGPASPPPKQRTGIWGVSPIAILLGLAVLHYFITKSVD